MTIMELPLRFPTAERREGTSSQIFKTLPGCYLTASALGISTNDDRNCGLSVNVYVISVVFFEIKNFVVECFS